jgi:hypothetical protein
MLKIKNIKNNDNKVKDENIDSNIYYPTWDDGEISWEFPNKEEKVMNYINYNIIQCENQYNKKVENKFLTDLEELHYRTLITLLLQNLNKELFTFENIINNIQNLNIFENEFQLFFTIILLISYKSNKPININKNKKKKTNYKYVMLITFLLVFTKNVNQVE